MSYESKRQYSYTAWRNAGFLRREALVLAKMPPDVPYLDNLRTSRLRAFHSPRWRDNPQSFATHIRRVYASRGWRKTGQKPESWVYNMINAVKQAYVARNPEYQSPKAKKKRDFVNYSDNYDRYRKAQPVADVNADEMLKRMYNG